MIEGLRNFRNSLNHIHSHQYLNVTAKLLGLFKNYTEMLGPILDMTPSDMSEDKGGLVANALKLRMGMVMTIKDCESPFFSYSNRLSS